MLDQSAVSELVGGAAHAHVTITYHKLPSVDKKGLLALLNCSGADTMDSFGCLHAIGGEVIGITSRDATVLRCADEAMLASQ